MKKTTLFIAVSAMLLPLSSGLAQSKAQENMFKSGDKDGNGVLSQSEYVAAWVARRQVAAEKRGEKIDAKQIGARMAKRFESLDSDGDGNLSDAEFYASFGGGDDKKKAGDKKKKKKDS